VASLKELEYWVSLCHFPGYTFIVQVDGRGAIYLQAHYMDEDIITHEAEMQFTRRWFLSPEMVKSEVVGTCFKCIITSMEHRTREGFTYLGKRIYGPHFDVDALASIAGQVEHR